jgi:DNA-binding IclR family transcriptional regulator
MTDAEPAQQAKPAEEERRAGSPQSVTRVIRLLEALCASTRPVSLADLARALDTPKSSLAALLRGLADEGFVDPVDGAWQLGPGAYGLGSALTEARRRLQTPDLVRQGMQRLARRCGETVIFGVRDAGGETLTYVEVIESRNPVRFAVPVGDRRPLYATAGGRALLAAATEAERERYFAGVRAEAFTRDTVTDRAGLVRLVEVAAELGVAQTLEQAAEGVAGTAAAVRDAGGAAIGALIVAAPASRLRDHMEALAVMVRDEAALISRSLGWRAT